MKFCSQQHLTTWHRWVLQIEKMFISAVSSRYPQTGHVIECVFILNFCTRNVFGLFLLHDRLYLFHWHLSLFFSFFFLFFFFFLLIKPFERYCKFMVCHLLTRMKFVYTKMLFYYVYLIMVRPVILFNGWQSCCLLCLSLRLNITVTVNNISAVSSPF